MSKQSTGREMVNAQLVSSALEGLGLPLWYVAERARVHVTTIHRWKHPGVQANVTTLIRFFQTVETLRQETNEQG